jgi:hypothetical protein
LIASFLVGNRDPIRLDTFRVATGIALISYMATWWLDDSVEWLTVAGFHLSPAAAGPGWLSPPPLPLWALAPFGTLFFAVLLAFTAGFRLPWSTVASLVFLLYVTHVDPLAAFTPNQLFLLTLVVLIVAPRGSYWTVDDAPVREVSVWPVRVLQATLILFYFTAGVCKALRGDWLFDSHVLYGVVQGPYQTRVGTWLLAHVPQATWTILQSLSLAFEISAPLLFAVRRLRVVAYLWGMGMHLGIGIAMDEFIHFGLQMMCFYILFMEEATLHAFRARVGAWGRRTVSLPWPRRS